MSRGPGRSPLAICMRIAASQRGVISADQAIAAGVSGPAIRRLVRKGTWLRVKPRVYALWVPDAPGERWRHRLWAAELWLGPGRSAVSHRAAAVAWELDGLEAAPIELSTTGRCRASEPGLVVHHLRSLPSREVVLLEGMPVTSVARTLVDLCAVVEPPVVELAVESAIRRGLATPRRILAAVERAGPTKPGRGVLLAMLRGLPGRATESALEALVWRLLRERGLPMPERQHEVRLGPAGGVARLDFAYPEHRLAIEADGHRFHASPRDWRRDLARQNALVGRGWTVYRLTWEDVTARPARVLADIERLLESGAARRPGGPAG